MKNLFKTLIAVVTVVCMFASMTAFAASQTTITKYGTNTEVKVVTTVSDVDADVNVTYLVAKDANGNGVADENEIKYIDQAKSDGIDIVFEYGITGGAWAAKEIIANVEFGSDNATVASQLNDDTVMFYDIPFTVKENGQPVEYAAEMSKNAIGKGDTTSVTISALPGYEIESITIGGVAADISLSAHEVEQGQTVEVAVKAIETTTVYLFEAEANDGLKVIDEKTGAELFVETGVGYYVGGPVDSAAIVFNGCNIDGEHDTFTYAAADVNKEAKSAFFAVQLASAVEADLKPATNAIVYIDGTPVSAK